MKSERNNEGDACVQTRRVHAAPKLVSWDKFVCNDVVLHAFGDGFLHEFAHGLEEGDGAMRFG